ncbi:MAG: hypothetical protein JKY54_16975 [Flavobacteriales bacterium]|nr:hypothetical protein [Flavobacteriales bacterium]
MNTTQFYQDLEYSLPKSSASDRKIWAAKIIDDNIEVKNLCHLLLCKEDVASRFLWLLGELGEIQPTKLFPALPHLLTLNSGIYHIRTEASFAKFWLLCGIPLENEGVAIDLLFGWIQSPNCNVTTKSRSLFVLFKMTEKYPDLKNELRLCLEEQLHKNTMDFDKRAKKLLAKLAH